MIFQRKKKCSKQIDKRFEKTPRKKKSTVGRTRWNCTKASKSTTIGWKAYGFCFLGFQRHIVHRLFEERKKNQQRLLLCIIGPTERRNRKKAASFDEEKMHFLQDNASAHKSIKMMAKINELRFGLLPHPSYFLNLAPSVFDLFPNLQFGYHSIFIIGIVFSCHLSKNHTFYCDSCQNSGLFKMKSPNGIPCYVR